MSGISAQAVLKKIRVSPRKLNLVAAAIRGKHVSDALEYLQLCPKRISTEVYKTLRSAVANAVNNDGAKVSALYVDEAFVGRSFTLKRFMARGRGRSSAIHKPFSHLSILISERDFEEED